MATPFKYSQTIPSSLTAWIANKLNDKALQVQGNSNYYSPTGLPNWMVPAQNMSTQNSSSKIIPAVVQQKAPATVQQTSKSIKTGSGTGGGSSAKVKSSNTGNTVQSQTPANVFGDAEQLAFSNAYDKAMSPNATPADIANVSALANKYGFSGMTSQDIVNARNYNPQATANTVNTNGQLVTNTANVANTGGSNVEPSMFAGDPRLQKDGLVIPANATATSLGGLSFADGIGGATNATPAFATSTNPNDPWSSMLKLYQPIAKPFSSYGEAWNKGEGVTGGLSNIWNQFTTENGSLANPTASGLEKTLGAAGQLSNLWSGIMNAKYQKDLVNLANKQQAFSEAQANRVNDLQNKAQFQYDASLK